LFRSAAYETILQDIPLPYQLPGGVRLRTDRLLCRTYSDSVLDFWINATSVRRRPDMKAAVISSSLIPVARGAAQESHSPQRVTFEREDAGLDEREPDAIRLTPRQLEVLALLCEGLPNKLICRQMRISAGTVKAHISGILRELGVASRLQAVVTARRLGLVPDSGDESARGDESRGMVGSRASATTVTTVDFGQRAAHRLNLTSTGR
jgi:DNA-binding CsgD family transcriptional regulator